MQKPYQAVFDNGLDALADKISRGFGGESGSGEGAAGVSGWILA